MKGTLAHTAIAPPTRNPGVATPSSRRSVLCGAPGCARPLTGRQTRYCSASCRFAAWDREHPRVSPRQRRLDLTPAPQPIRALGEPPLSKAERARLKPSALAILGRLQQGPATNVELLAIGGFRYGGRIHELRGVGHNIPEPENLGGGKRLYRLIVQKPLESTQEPASSSMDPTSKLGA
jgi:hypothetical protein